jgi:hypothetical protein
MMVRFKTNNVKSDVFHIVNTKSMDIIQWHYNGKQEILGIYVKKTYKTLKGAMKGVKECETIVWEKAA